MRCIVCDADKANYRCRTCRSAYCSSKCYKRHRVTRAEAEAAAAAAATDETTATSSYEHLCEAVMAAQQPAREREEKRQRTEAEADVFSDLSREKAAATAGSSSSSGGGTAPACQEGGGGATTTPSPSVEGPTKPAAPPAELAGDADAVYILQEKHLAALANHPRVRSALRSPSLQKLIRTIDSSRSRLDALDAAQYNNADFKDFCDEVMHVIAEVEGR